MALSRSTDASPDCSLKQRLSSEAIGTDHAFIVVMVTFQVGPGRLPSAPRRNHGCLATKNLSDWINMSIVVYIVNIWNGE